jgi:hypothetical protein
LTKNDGFSTIVGCFFVDKVSANALLSSLMQEATSHKVVKKGKINRKNMLSNEKYKSTLPKLHFKHLIDFNPGTNSFSIAKFSLRKYSF